MDHPDGSPPPGPSPPSAASPTHHTPPASPPHSSSDDPTSLSSPRFVLYLGCDYSEEEEDEEEELRNVKETTEEDLIPPALPELKLSSLFSLTPVLTRKPSEGSRQPHDLFTPYQSTSTSDCPERPSKTHQSSASHCETSTSTSCRLLFSEAASRLCSEASTRKDDSNNHHIFPVLPVTTKQSTPPPMEVEGTPSPPPPPPSSTPNTQSHGFKGDGEELPTPIHSPSSSSSSCSDCVACSSESCSLEIATPYLLSPPILPQIKLTSLILSSPEEDINKAPTVNKALDLPLPCEFNEIPQEGENVDVEDLNPQDTPQEDKDAMEDSEEEVVVQKVKEPPLSALEGLREVCAAALRLQHEHLDTSLTPSSAGSVRSNWTVMSGISPLPSSDPTHLRYHHHRHHGHHHHGHHHHGHHRHHHKHHLSSNEDNMVTSTPIHQRHVPQGVNVSAVTTSPEVFSDPRFMSSELGSSEFQSDMTAGEGGGVVMPLASSGSDKENIEDCPAPVTLPETLQSTSIKKFRGFIQTDRSGTDQRQDIQTGVGSAGLETSRQHTNGKNNDNNEGDEEGTNNEGDEEETNNEMQQIKDARSRKKREREDEREALSRDRRQRSLCRPLFSPYAQSRPLSKAEVRAMAAGHVNFSEKYLFPEDVPSPRHCSTMDDSLFRAVALDSPMSVSMD